VEIYGENLEQQMAALIGLIPEIEWAEVDVKLKPIKSFGIADGIEEVIVEVQATDGNKGDGVVSPVKPIEIKEKKSKEYGQYEYLKKKILNCLSDFYGIDKKLIKVSLINP